MVMIARMSRSTRRARTTLWIAVMALSAACGTSTPVESPVGTVAAHDRAAFEAFLVEVVRASNEGTRIANAHSSPSEPLANNPSEGAKWADDLDALVTAELAWLDSHPATACYAEAAAAWRGQMLAARRLASTLRVFSTDPTQTTLDALNQQQQTDIDGDANVRRLATVSDRLCQ